jgi:hypothetical protein
MDLYISSLALGAAGLGAMALGGLGFRGHAPGAHAGHGAVGNTVGHHGGHVITGVGHASHGHAAAHGHGLANAAHAQVASIAQSARETASNAAWTLASPRFLFSLALGFGVAGELTRPLFTGPLHLAVALLGGVIFERFLVSPLWNFSMRFASSPATTLESSVTDEATAVTSFDGNGQGIVSVEVDGQIVQILATLRGDDRLLGGARIRAGQRVRIEEVDAEKNCCTVSLI